MTATPHTDSPTDVLTAEGVNDWITRQNVALSDAPQLAAAPEIAVQCLREFVELNGRRPVAGPTVSEAERTLARWAVEREIADDDVAAILVAYPPRRGRPSTAQIPQRLSDLLAPASVEETQDPMLEQLRAFVTEHQHRPASSRDLVPAEEANLYAWMIKQLNRGNQQVADLVDGVPGRSPQSPGAKRADQLEAIRSFLETNDRRPLRNAHDKDERRLATWIHYERRRGGLPDDIEQLLFPEDAEPRAYQRRPFAVRLLGLEEFIDTHGHLPRRRSDSAEEASLAEWLTKQRLRTSVDPRLTEVLAGRLITEPLPVPDPTPAEQERDAEKLEELRTFCLEHGRLPTAGAGKKKERRLRMWITKRRIETVPGLADLLDEYPTPRELLTQRAYDKREVLQRAAESRCPWPTNPQVMARLEQLRAFIAEHGTVPNRRSDSYDEEHLGHWAYRHTRLPHPHPEVMELLEGAGGYGAMGITYTTEERREQLETFVAQHERLPSASGEDEVESSLAKWTYHHQSRVNPDPRVLELIEQFGGYRAVGSTVIWSGELALFCAIHGRLPSDTNPGEARLTAWMYRSADRHEPTSVLGMLLAAYPTFQDIKKKLAQPVAVSATKNVRLRRMKELASFRAEHGRMPSAGAEDPIERSLSAWVSKNAHGPATHPAVSALIHGSIDVGTEDETPGRQTYQTAQVTPRLISETPEVLDRIKKLEGYVEAHGRLPRTTTEDVEERRLGQWAYQQLRAGRAHPRVAEIVEAHGGYRRPHEKD